MACGGYRTLLIAQREVPPGEYTTWSAAYGAAQVGAGRVAVRARARACVFGGGGGGTCSCPAGTWLAGQ
jgi:hypothetical protein